MQDMQIYIGLPALNEKYLADRIRDLERQTLLPKAVFVCVKQPRSYWTDGIEEHLEVCKVNQDCIRDLHDLSKVFDDRFALHVLDRSSGPLAWEEKHLGVGWARKTCLDTIAKVAQPEDIMVWMDADTCYPPTYLQRICESFSAHREVDALSIPYFHCLKQVSGRPPGSSASGLHRAWQYRELSALPAEKMQLLEKTFLHYEIYMRSYALHLFLTAHPYRFSAVGSAIAHRVSLYTQLRGMTPVKSGEDFYFLQKVLKNATVSVDLPVAAFPMPRPSNRVFFGTGPAINKGMENDWKSYPIYPYRLFQELQAFYQAIPSLFGHSGADYPMRAYWEEKFGAGWLQPLRENAKKQRQFVRSVVQKIDALRTLQFLKEHYAYSPEEDMAHLKDLLQLLMDHPIAQALPRAELSGIFETDSLEQLSLEQFYQIRKFLFLCERKFQKASPLLRLS